MKAASDAVKSKGTCRPRTSANSNRTKDMRAVLRSDSEADEAPEDEEPDPEEPDPEEPDPEEPDPEEPDPEEPDPEEPGEGPWQPHMASQSITKLPCRTGTCIPVLP